MRFNKDSFTSTRDQSVMILNRLLDDNERRRFGQAFHSADNRLVMILGLQPDGKFGIEVYERNGDELTKTSTGELVTALSPQITKFENNNYVKVTDNNGKAEVVIQDTYRIETLKSVYPVGSVYENLTDSTNPKDIMNWSSSTWERQPDAVLVSKDLANSGSEPQYQSVYRWKRTG